MPSLAQLSAIYKLEDKMSGVGDSEYKLKGSALKDDTKTDHNLQQNKREYIKKWTTVSTKATVSEFQHHLSENKYFKIQLSLDIPTGHDTY